MKTYDVIVVGAGPAGLGAAIQAGQAGASVLLLDENDRPGGQLFKQIHKFFGSREHCAGTRGYDIGLRLLRQAEEAGVETALGHRVWGIFPDGSVTAATETESVRCRGRFLVLATGASENALSFPGCTLPGVMTAGAAQTFANIHHVLPGRDIVMIGSGNVGLIVTYQLLQAGANVKAILEAAPHISGYAVHAGKVRRAGVPILLGHTVTRAIGEETLAEIEIAQVDEHFRPVPGTEQTISCDTLCLAVGLSPRLELAQAAGCRMVWSGPLGGLLPVHSPELETSVEHILVAGDLAGIEEASTALDEGRLAGLRAAFRLGLLEAGDYEDRSAVIRQRLDCLRQGPFGEGRRRAKEEVWSHV